MLFLRSVFILLAAALMSACVSTPPSDLFMVQLRVRNSAISAPRVIKIDRYQLTFAPTEGYQYPSEHAKTFSVSTGYDSRPSLRLGETLPIYSSQPSSFFMGSYTPDSYSHVSWNGVVPSAGTLTMGLTYEGDPLYYTYSGAIAGTSVTEKAVDYEYDVDDSYCDPYATTSSTKPGDPEPCYTVHVGREITLTVDVDVKDAIGQ